MRPGDLGSNLGRVKPKTFKIGTLCILAKHSARKRMRVVNDNSATWKKGSVPNVLPSINNVHLFIYLLGYMMLYRSMQAFFSFTESMHQINVTKG